MRRSGCCRGRYRGGGCGDRGVVTSTPYLAPAPPTSPSFAPSPNSQKRKRRRCLIRSAARAAVSRARELVKMDIFEPFQKRFQQSAHKQEYRGGGCGDRGVVTSTPYLAPALSGRRMRRSGCCHVDPVPGAGAADITIVRPQPEFAKKKTAALRRRRSGRIRPAARLRLARARKAHKEHKRALRRAERVGRMARGRRAPRRIEQDLIEQDLAATAPPIFFLT